MIEFRTLGTLDLRDPGNGREFGAMLARPKRVALLAYLTLAQPRGVHHRDTLLGIFWPETSQERARHALSQALYVLRRALGGGVVVTRGAEEIGIDVAELWCDAAAFEAAFTAGKWEEALELYGGDLLNGFYLSDCPEFEKWRDGERARLRERASEAAWSLADRAEEAGNAVAAAHWGRRASAFAPGDEGALRRLIVLLDRVGDRTGALREYEAFAEQVRQDYEAEPAPETQELVERVRARQQANGGVLSSVPITKPTNDDPVTRVTVEARRSWRTRPLSAAALVALTVTVAGATLIRNSRGSPALDPTRVLVDIFQNETGDPSLDHLGRMATDRVTAGLTLTRFVDVVSLGTRLLSREPVVPDTGLLEHADLQALARANETGTVVSGSYYLQGDSVHFLAHVTDAGTGEELAALEPVVGAIDTPVAAIEQLRDRVMTTLATLTDPRLAKWIRYASRPPTFEAYTEFVEGLEQYSQQKHGEALRHFLAAAALDSNFTMASLWVAWEFENTGQMARRDSLDQALNRRRGQLAPLDRLLLDYNLAWRRGDLYGKLEAMRRFVEIAPGSEFLYKAGQAAVEAGRPREAIEFLTQADPESGWLLGWSPYWGYLTQAYHMLGEHQEELAVARRARRRFPNFLRIELRALAALGRIDEVQALLDEEEEEAQRIVFAQYAAGDLLVHDHVDAASQLLDRGIMWGQAWLSTLPPDTTSRAIGDGISRLAEMLVLHGRVDEARVVLERALEEERANGRSRRSWFIGTLGVIAGLQGDRGKALGIGQDLAAQPWISPSDKVMWQARIAASLGEIERATALFRESVVGGWGSGMDIHFDLSLFRGLWDHPPFQELIKPKG